MAKYHHGDLPAALRSATAELIAENGPSGFSLREVARRAGVSHAAPAHHFGDTEGLLTSLAAEGYQTLADAMEEAAEGVDDAMERMRRIGASYVRVARENPGHFAVMIQNDLVCGDDPTLLEHSIRANTALQGTMEMVRDQLNPDLDVDSTATLLWAGAHGFVEICPVREHVAEQTETAMNSIDDLLVAWTDMVIDGIRAR